MKKVLSWTSNAILIGMASFLLFKKIMVWENEHQLKQKPFIPFQLSLLEANGNRKNQWIGHDDSKKVLIFWSTDCPPCKIELMRVQNLLHAGTLKTTQVIALSLFESPALVQKVVKERQYTFTVAFEPEEGHLASQLNISGTPTTILIEGNKIISFSTGITLLLEKKLKDFFES